MTDHVHVFGRWFHIPISDWYERRCSVPGCKASESSLQDTARDASNTAGSE